MFVTSFQTQFSSTSSQSYSLKSKTTHSSPSALAEKSFGDSFERRQHKPLHFTAYALSEKHKGAGDDFDPEKYRAGGYTLHWKSISNTKFGLTTSEREQIIKSLVAIGMATLDTKNLNSISDAEDANQALVKQIIDNATYPTDWEPSTHNEQISRKEQ